MEPLASRRRTRKVASNTLAMPLIRTLGPRAAPQAGRSTKIAGSWLVKSARSTPWPRSMPAFPIVSTAVPSIWISTSSTVGNWVTV